MRHTPSSKAVQELEQFMHDNMAKSSEELQAEYRQTIADLQQSAKPESPANPSSGVLVVTIVKIVVKTVVAVLVKRSV